MDDAFLRTLGALDERIGLLTATVASRTDDINQHDKALTSILARLDALEGKQQTPAPEPRPKLMYVDEVPADGTCEIRWWNSASSAWSDWCRVLGESDTRDRDGRRRLRLHDDDRFSPPQFWSVMKRDECVQVRPVMDPQTGDTLGEVA